MPVRERGLALRRSMICPEWDGTGAIAQQMRVTMSEIASPIRFVLVGGFLGSGKTTTLLRLARHYTAAGRRVGVLTNDQAEGLVDTETFRSAGVAAEGGPPGGFCCRFDALVAAAGRPARGHRPG